MTYNKNIPLEVRAYKTNSKALVNSDKITVNIQTEFLDECEFNCPGCFVKRRNQFTPNDLKVLNHLVSQFDDTFELNEIILGPTDLFGANNTKEILLNPKFISLVSKFEALTFNSTLMSGADYVRDVYRIIEKHYSSVYLEMFIVLDIEKYLNNDEKYLNLLDENLNTLKDANIIFVYNIHNKGMFDGVDFAALRESIKDRYNSHFKMNPSFFRSHKIPLILDNLKSWADQVTKLYEENNQLLFNMIDEQFGGFTYLTYLFKNGNLYVNPYIYDFIFDNHESLIVDHNNKYFLDEIFKLETRLTKMQYHYASETKDCKHCEFLTSCVSKRVLSFMENHEIKECFLPKNIMQEVNGK